MRANAGGIIAASEVVGRDGLIAEFWHILEEQSLVIVAERRIGKTTILNKMKAEAPSDRLPIYMDLERSNTALEFAEQVYRSVEQHLAIVTRVVQRGRQAAKLFGGTDVAGFHLPDIGTQNWKELLAGTIGALAEHQEGRVVVFLDELPYMLQNIVKHEGERVGEEILAVLRSLRQEYPEVRMVYTGSIGLHHVIASLRHAGYNGPHTNDMFLADCPPLEVSDAADLARRLLTGEGKTMSDADSVARAIAGAVNGIPFYIHHLVARLPMKHIDPVVVEETVVRVLTMPDDPLDLSHFVNRVPIYYGPRRKLLALRILDAIASSLEPLTFNDILNDCRAGNARASREAVLEMVDLLARDHYLQRDPDGRLQFRFSFISRYWRLRRGL